MDTNLDTICWHLTKLRNQGEAPAEIMAAFEGLDDRLTRIEQKLYDLAVTARQAAEAAEAAEAAAPELLAACEDLIRDSEARPGAYIHARGLDAIRAAIAKARRA